MSAGLLYFDQPRTEADELSLKYETVEAVRSVNCIINCL